MVLFARRSRPTALLAIAFLLVTAVPVAAQTIEQSRGVDARVDYASLIEIGPWDDRNYQLTQDDLALLAPNEREITEGIPAFYRVHMRKTWTLAREGKVQYPRSALPRFLNEYGGYRIGRTPDLHPRRASRKPLVHRLRSGWARGSRIQGPARPRR